MVTEHSGLTAADKQVSIGGYWVARLPTKILTDDIYYGLGRGVAVLVVGDTGILAGLVAAEAVVEHQSRPISDDLTLELPEVVGLGISRREALDKAPG